MKIVDVMKNSLLPKGEIIRDVLSYGCDPRKIDRSISLPRRTIEAYY